MGAICWLTGLWYKGVLSWTSQPESRDGTFVFPGEAAIFAYWIDRHNDSSHCCMEETGTE